MSGKKDTKDRLIVLSASFVLFIGGVLALRLEQGPLRTALVAGSIAALLAIALRQTIRRLKK